MMIEKGMYGDKIKFSRVSQGKPKFKVPIKGQTSLRQRGYRKKLN